MHTQGFGIIALVLASGCFGGQKLTDTDPNPGIDTDGPASLEAPELCPAEDFAATCGEDGATSLVATNTGPLRIAVEHRGLELGCGTWSADATAADGEIFIEYLSSEDTTGDCACAWNFTYWLPVVEAGTYTILAEGDTTVVTVE